MPIKELFDQLHIIAFNRPWYYVEVAQSIREALRAVNESIDVHIWIDGYSGSRDHAIGRKDETDSVANISAQIFPCATIHKQRTNIGTARIYERAESHARRTSHCEFALFFEDDYVLATSYMTALTEMMKWATKKEEVSIVTAHGISYEYMAKSMGSGASWSPKAMVWPHSLWAFAVKISHLKERKKYMLNYLDNMKRTRYWKRDNNEVARYHASRGMPFIPGSSQDYAKHAALLYHGKIAVTIPLRLGRYIGMHGEHTNAEIYRDLGYDAIETNNRSPRDIRELLPETIDAELIRWSRIQELFHISSLQALHESSLECGRLGRLVELCKESESRLAAEKEALCIELEEMRMQQDALASEVRKINGENAINLQLLGDSLEGSRMLAKRMIALISQCIYSKRR